MNSNAESDYTAGRISCVKGRIEPICNSLLTHPLYQAMETKAHLHTFMECHVFAVWDFMTLLKSLQRKVTHDGFLWAPPRNQLACRLVNEIVLGEESDVDRDGSFQSHFDLYLTAMRECGANTERVERFVELVQSGVQVDVALRQVDAPGCVRKFVQQTVTLATTGSACEMAAALTFGREQLLPDVFRRFVEQVDHWESGALTAFVYYLDRHIELDGDVHGELAEQMIASLCGDDAEKWRQTELMAEQSLQSRLALWNGIHQLILSERGESSSVAAESGEDYMRTVVHFAWLHGMSREEISRQSNLSLQAVDDMLRSSEGTTL